MGTVAALLWTPLQSIFTVPIEQWNSNCIHDPALDYVMLGFSVWAIITCTSGPLLEERCRIWGLKLMLTVTTIIVGLIIITAIALMGSPLP